MLDNSPKLTLSDFDMQEGGDKQTRSPSSLSERTEATD